MSEDKLPQRPDGVPAPRVEVESTPQAGQAGQHQSNGAAAQQPNASYQAQYGQQYNQGQQQAYGRDAQAGKPSGTAAQPDAAGAQPTQQQPATQSQQTSQYPFVPSTADPGATGGAPVSTRTVVKTKAKKLPVFLASFAGLAVGAILVIALVMTGAFTIKGGTVESSSASSGSKGSSQTIDINSEDTTLAEAVSAKALPSVASITVQTSGSSNGLTSQSDSSSSGSIGSGVVLDTDGNILTNYHVVEGATAIAVSLDGQSYEAEVVGTDESSDLAVIKLKDADASKLTPIEVGDSDKLTVGEWVMAIGSPYGNEQSVSTGIVSALYRSTALPSTSGTSIYANMIQTDAAINPGNSGGALVDSEGKLIGINSIIESYSGSSSGVGFAIPANYAVKIAKEIIAGKTPVHPYLGVTLTSVTALNRQSNVSEGAQVVEVANGGPAEQAGIEKGDVITEVDGEAVTSADGLIIALREHEVGDKVKLKLVRSGKEQEVEVTLGSDEELQKSNEGSGSSNGQGQQGDSTEGSGSGNGMTQDELLQYLEELMGRGQNGQQGQ